MAQFRKKPVVVEAVQLLWDNFNEMNQHASVGKLSDGQPEVAYRDNGGDGKHDGLCLYIPTFDGLVLAEEGDWIIKGVKGELDSCKPDIFAATYEAAA